MTRNVTATSARTLPARRLTLTSSRPIVRREAPVHQSVKASKAHRDRLPGMVYADRLTAIASGWDQRLTSTARQAQRDRYADATGTPGRTIAHV